MRSVLWLAMGVALAGSAAEASSLSRRGFLGACAGFVATATVAHAEERMESIAISARWDVDELGIEAVGQTIKEELLSRGWVATEKEAETKRRELQRELWRQVQRAAFRHDGDGALLIPTEVLVKAGAKEMRLRPTFRIEVDGTLETERGLERLVEAVQFVGDGRERLLKTLLR